MIKGSMERILRESKPYDFLLLLVSAVVGFVLSRVGDSDITCTCATIIVVSFILFWFLYNIIDANADYMKMINREFKNEHWYDAFYLAFPICATLRRMGKYNQAIKVALKINQVLNKINIQKIDNDWINMRDTSIDKIRERIMINDLGYTYFMLKKIRKAKQYIYQGISIAREGKGIEYVELKGYTILLQMVLVDYANKFFDKEEERVIYNEFRKQFDRYWGGLNGAFPDQGIKDYVSYLKSIEIEAQYKLWCETIDEQQFIAVMNKIAEGYRLKGLNDKYYDSQKRILETKLKNPRLKDGDTEAILHEILDGAFDANIGLTPVQYVKYVVICLEYYTRIEAESNKKTKDKRDKEETMERKKKADEYIKRVERELWYIEDPCMNRFKKAKKMFKKAL